MTSKFNRFVSDLALRNITCQNRTLDFDRIVREKKVLLFYLGKGRFGDLAAGLMASQLISRIRVSVMKRGTGSDEPPFYLYADEFQLFADERFAELLAEARKFKLALTLAHQYSQQIPEPILRAVLGNVGTTIVFRVGSEDSQLLQPQFSPAFSHRDLTSLSNFRAYVRTFGTLGETPFSIDVPPPPGDVFPWRPRWVREMSRIRYGRERETVEKEIRDTYGAYLTAAENPESKGLS